MLPPLKTLNVTKEVCSQKMKQNKERQKENYEVVISKIQEHISNGAVFDVRHVTSKDQLGDVLTKKGVCSEKILSVLQTGKLQINPHITGRKTTLL